MEGRGLYVGTSPLWVVAPLSGSTLAAKLHGFFAALRQSKGDGHFPGSESGSR